MNDFHRELVVKDMGRTRYQDVWHAMRDYTDQRTAGSPNELWLTEHAPVFTQGQAGKPEHLLHSSEIPVVKTDRGGQITYHGPGQLVVYPLLNLKAMKLGVRDLVTAIETSVVECLKEYGISAAAKPDAPGVYVDNKKIASLGLRVRKGCSYHGVAINVCADLKPFQQINPCGYQGLEMVNINDVSERILSVRDVKTGYINKIAEQLNLELI
ncbi:MAG: lipoyl(octanoyl) transferase LipB [Agarilytica sp.]